MFSQSPMGGLGAGIGIYKADRAMALVWWMPSTVDWWPGWRCRTAVPTACQPGPTVPTAWQPGPTVPTAWQPGPADGLW